MSVSDTITVRAPGATGPVGWRWSTAALIMIGSLAGLLHLLPLLHATATTPPGWHFTGNVTISPDYMQYRTWARQTQEMGPIVDNRFTAEPNPPHLLVGFYYLVGQLSRWTGLTPEFAYAYLGVPLAFVLTVLLFITVRMFLSVPSHVWWVTGLLLAGGGLGAHLKVLEGIAAVRDSPVLQRLLIEPLWNQGVFENHRGNYVVIALFDTHFLAIWIVTLAAVLSLYLTLRQYSAWRLIGTAAVFGFATLFHVYEGVTLVAIAAGVAACCWVQQQQRRTAMLALVSCTGAVALCTLALAVLYHRSGLPVSPWRGVPVLFATLLIAHPVGWLALATAGSRFWSRWDIDRCFLAGWLLGWHGCDALGAVLSVARSWDDDAAGAPLHPGGHGVLLTTHARHAGGVPARDRPRRCHAGVDGSARLEALRIHVGRGPQVHERRARHAPRCACPGGDPKRHPGRRRVRAPLARPRVPGPALLRPFLPDRPLRGAAA
jgi:hypothetical protein